MKRTSNLITKKEDIDYLLSLDYDTVLRLSFIMDTFGEKNGKHRFNTYDLVTIPPGSYGKENKKNKNSFTTTVGLWIFNKCFIEEDLFDLFHYISEPANKKTLGKINTKISYALLEDKIPLAALKRYLMKTQKYQPYSDILAAGFTVGMLTISDKLNKRKAELIKKNKDKFDAGDEIVAAQVQKELLDYAKELLKDDPSMDIYASGAKGSYGNNFKNIFVMRGAVKDPDPTKGYDIITSSYIDGISKDDYVKTAKSLAAGPYARAKKTAKGGYWEKLFLRALQHVVLLPPGTDCGTKKTITITITPDLADMVIYNYIVEKGKLIELTSDNIDSYMNKTVQMRFSSLCQHKDGICNVCAGNMFYRAGFRNVGVATPQLASRLKNISLKAFHDSQVKLHEIDVGRAFGME